MTQTLHIHLEEYAPGGRTQKHGHVNEAAFYILDGEGLRNPRRRALRLAGGRRRDRAQQLRAPALQRRPDKPARALVLKTKPMFMFMNMLFQQSVIPRPKEPAPGGEGFDAAHDDENYNHE